MDFLSSLPGKSSSSPAKKPAPSRPSAPARAPAVSLRVGGSEISPMVLYVGGGAAALVLLIILIAVGVSMTSSGKSASSNQPNKVDHKSRFNLPAAAPHVAVAKYGLSEKQRQQMFCDLMEAVDKYGMGERCKKEWLSIGADQKLSPDIVKKILQEGFDDGWEQPKFSNYTVKSKYNRLEWIKKRNESKTEPMF